MENQEITLKAGEPVTLPSGDVVTLHHTGSQTQGTDTVQTAVVIVQAPGK